MRFLYVDEAGTATHEPVTVVIAVVVNADTQWWRAETVLQTAFDEFVPESLRKNFVFHAKDVFGGGQYRSIWDREERWALIDRVLGIPKLIGLPICIGKAKRHSTIDEPLGIGMSPEQEDHFWALAQCLAAADRYLREHAREGEIATVVAEDVPETRRFLRLVARVMRILEVKLEPEHMLPGSAVRKVYDPKISRIVDDIHFAEKQGAVLLQIADACAFAFRRFLSGQNHGKRFIDAMHTPVNLEEWMQGDWSNGIYIFEDHGMGA